MKRNKLHEYKVVLGLTREQFNQLETWQDSALRSGRPTTKQELIRKMLEHGFTKVDGEISQLASSKHLTLIK